METAQVVAFVAFLVVAIVVAALARRAGWFLSRTREAEGFRGAAADLARRVEISLGDVGFVIDAVRRRTTEPETITPSLVAARDAIERYTDEVRALRAPHDAVPYCDAIVAELERAGRAIELVEHGCALFVAHRRIARGSEAETAVKRGYLNLIHARESIAEQAKHAIDRAEDASPVRRFGRRSA